MSRQRDPICVLHDAVGRVAWPTGIPVEVEAHASTYVCALEACQADAVAWVEEITGHPGVLVPFGVAAS
jgi:hypothetical protein